jgi:hypothetical protein
MNEEDLFVIFSKIYGEPSYFQENKHIIFVGVMYWILLFFICSYLYYLTNVESIKNNWVENRCKLSIIPFAGWINAPEGVSPKQYTSENFTFCVQNMVSTFTQYLLLPIQFIISVITTFFSDIAKAVNNIRDYIHVIKQKITLLVNEIYNRIINVMIPFQNIFIKFSDILDKLKGVLATFMYAILDVYYAIKATMGVIIDFIVGILVSLAVMLSGLIATYGVFAATAFINPFSAVMMPILMTMIMVYVVLFLAISIPSLIFVVFCKNYLHMQSKAFPSLPTCFDMSVKIKLNNMTYIPIYYIKPGMILCDNNRVECIMKCKMTKNQYMHSLKDDLVTSFHRVKYSSYGIDNWIHVNEHPDNEELDDYFPNYVYCMNTYKKTITTKSYEYLDWDDIDCSLNIYDNSYNSTHNIKGNLIEVRDGFYHDTLVLTNINKGVFCYKPIYEIQIGDNIYLGEIVIGIVLVDILSNTQYDKEPNYTQSIWETNVNEYKHLYNFHLITSSGTFCVLQPQIENLPKKICYVQDYSDTSFINVKKYCV